MELLLKIKSNTSLVQASEHLTKLGIRVVDKIEAFSILCIEGSTIEDVTKLHFVEQIDTNDHYMLQNVNVNILPNIRHRKLRKHSYLGNDIKVAVIDSGITPMQGYNVSNNQICSFSKTSDDAMVRNEYHGTVVASIIKELAPWCQITNVKIVDDNKNIKKNYILKALEYVYTSDIKIVNMSLGKNGDCDSNCFVCTTVSNLRSEGFIVVTAIGNEGQRGEGITGCPGNCIEAITVGAVDVNKNLAPYSSTARPGVKKPDLLAPGTTYFNQKPYYGTSFATPFVTGVIAASNEKFELEYIVESILKTTKSIGLPYHKQGNGLLHIEDLLEVLIDEGNVSEG
jgi:subtilisin family serine protease